MSDSQTSPGRDPAEAGGPYLRLIGLLAMRPGEVARSLLTFCYLFLIIAAYLMLKAIRNSLFISEFGAMKLPYVMIGIAVLAAVFASIYIRLARRRSTPHLIFWSLAFFASNLLLFWWLAVRGLSWLYPVLYVWAGVFGVIGPTQVWTLSSELFTTREAKRLFGVVGAGGILGSIAGGALAGALAPVLGTANLLLVVMGMLLLAAFIVRLLARMRTVSRPVAAGQKPPQNLTESLRLIRSSGHLRLLAGLIFITALATTSVDFQFNVVAERAVEGRDALTAFFGKVYSGISILSFAIQIVLTSRLLATVGVGICILLLPVSLASGTLALFASGSLWAGVLLKGSDGSLKHSLDRSCRELMYLPVPSSVRSQAKSTIDTVMDRLGDGSAGVLQLLITAALGLSLGGSLIANFLLITVWIVIALRLKRAYVNQLSTTLGRRRGADELPVEAEADTRRALESVLRSGSEAEKLAALEWIRRNSVPMDDETLLDLAHDPESAGVRNAALGVLLSGDVGELPPDMLAALEEEGQAVLVAAIDVLVEPDADRIEDRLEALLDRAGETTRLSVVAFMLRRLGPEFAPFATRVFEALLSPQAPAHARAAAVRAMALLPADSTLLDRLAGALEDPDPAVASAAADAAGRLSRADLIPRLIQLLGRRSIRAAARDGLLAFGERAVPELGDALHDPATPVMVRRQLPRLLGELCTFQSSTALVAGLNDLDPAIRESCLRALYAIRRRYPDQTPPQIHRLRQGLHRLLNGCEELVEAERAFGSGGEPAGEGMGWLVDALENERLRRLSWAFLLISLEHPVRETQRCWMAIRDGSPRDRANAVELLDNMLPKGTKSRLLPLLEPVLGGRTDAGSLEGALLRLIEGPDPWLAAYALHAARERGVTGLAESARRAAVSRHAVLREEAAAFLETLGEEGAT